MITIPAPRSEMNVGCVEAEIGSLVHCLHLSMSRRRICIMDRRETRLVVLTCEDCIVERGGPSLSAVLALCIFRVQFLLRLGQDVGERPRRSSGGCQLIVSDVCVQTLSK